MSKPTPILIAHWATRIVTAGILAMGAIPKFTGGAAALAEKLPGGSASAIAIGVAEVAAIALMFIPRLTLVGSGLAALIMLGAVASHIVGPVGMEGDFASMFVMALVALGSSVAATAIAWRRGLRVTNVGPKGRPAQP